MEIMLVVVGAVIGIGGSLATEWYKQRGRRDEQRDDLYRRKAGAFVGLATTARYEYERMAADRHVEPVAQIPSSFDEADAELAKAYHELTLIVDGEALESARLLRGQLEALKHWSVEAPTAELTPDAVRNRVRMAAQVRDRFVTAARSELGLSQSPELVYATESTQPESRENPPVSAAATPDNHKIRPRKAEREDQIPKPSGQPRLDLDES